MYKAFGLLKNIFIGDNTCSNKRRIVSAEWIYKLSANTQKAKLGSVSCDLCSN